jgi:regulator of microtubule dynamics protein 3
MRLDAVAVLLSAALCAAPAALAAQGTAGGSSHDAVYSVDPRADLTRYEAMLAADSTDYEANWRAALALIDLGKQSPDDHADPARDSLYARAERLARRAVQARPDDAQGHFVLANAVGRASLTKSKKERVRRATEIRSEALRAIELDASHDGAYHVLGRWNAEIMRLSGVARFFAKRFLGGAVFDQASWASAVSNMEKAVELNPTQIYHRLDLATVYADVGRYAEARAQLERVASLPEKDVMDAEYKREAAALLRKIADRRDS